MKIMYEASDTSKLRQKISAILNKDYDHETPDKPRSSDYNRAIKAWLKSQLSDCEIYATKNAWCEASGYIEKDGKFVYYRFPDYRWEDWSDRILIRKAESLKDYTGGANYFTDIDNMIDEVRWLLSF